MIDIPGRYKVRLTTREEGALGIFTDSELEVIAASPGEASSTAVAKARELGFETGQVLRVIWQNSGERYVSRE